MLRFPLPLRFLLASYPELMGKEPGIVQRVLSTHVIKAPPQGVGPAHPCAHGISASMHVKAEFNRATVNAAAVGRFRVDLSEWHTQHERQLSEIGGIKKPSVMPGV